jgi:hypothetical protein
MHECMHEGQSSIVDFHDGQFWGHINMPLYYLWEIKGSRWHK